MKTTKRHSLKLIITGIFVFTLFNLFGQNVVVSEYFNEADTRDEWTELLVIADNTDLRNYKLRDNNGSQDNWQTEITFSNVSLWNNLRAGTIIVIWHRKRSSTVSSDRLVDTLKSDGYIEVHSQLNGYFSGGDFGTSPTWAGSSLAIGGSGEIIQLLDASNNHIYALGHKSSITNSGNNFAAISSSNKLNHASAIISGSNISISPGTNIAAYIGGTSDTLKTSEGSSYLTQGLPNKRVSDTTSNQNYWRSLRQPTYTNPTLNTITTNSNGTQFNLSWSACTDPNPSDSTTGYLILRNSTNVFNDPTDNIIYSDGNTIGTATIVKHINFSSTLAFTDNYNLNCGDTLFYKIYAFRYKADNNSVSNLARGRAYNETGTNVQSIIKSLPLNQNISAN